MMSSEADKRMMDTEQCCAGCGVKEDSDDDIKLKNCTACYLVKYCGIKCQKKHRPQHKRACKQRAAELRDELLFKQPESCHLGDCPICYLPLPIEPRQSTMMVCCCKLICNGCDFANKEREVEANLEFKCPFCRCPLPDPDDEAFYVSKLRMKPNDPAALYQLGIMSLKEKDNKSAFEYLTKAAGLDSMDAHFNLSLMYHHGQGVEKDEKKEIYHLEEAAIGGHDAARTSLVSFEGRKGRQNRVTKHLIIAAKMGCDHSLDYLKNFYQMGLVSKEILAGALRAHQAAVDATKSPQREAAEALKVV